MKVNFKTIFVQSSLLSSDFYKSRIKQVLSKFPDAEIQEVKSHNSIEELRSIDPVQWVKSKRDYLVLGYKSGLNSVPNTKSSDFIAPSHVTGCLASCQYCYVARYTGGSNPARAFINIDEIVDSIDSHQKKLGAKPKPNQQDPVKWIYDIGCNNDNSLDALYIDNPLILIERFASMDNAKASFATKFVNEEAWSSVDPKGNTRIRYSLMPQEISTHIDIRTSRISDRIASINNLVDMGYEVHVNFSPVVIYGGNRWIHAWKELFDEINDTLTARAKKQLKCEVIFLTHSESLHELNMKWNPKGESFLHGQAPMHPKYNKPDVLVYNYKLKAQMVKRFVAGIQKYLPYCKVRYAF